MLHCHGSSSQAAHEAVAGIGAAPLGARAASASWSYQYHQQQQLQEPSLLGLLEASGPQRSRLLMDMPVACAAAAVLSQLSGVELLLARMQLQAGGPSRAAAEPEFPRVEGRDPAAVIAFLTQEASATEQVCALGWQMTSAVPAT